MEMKNPVHPGLLVEECLNDLELSVATASKALGVSRQQLHNVIAGRSGITPEMAIRFEKGACRRIISHKASRVSINMSESVCTLQDIPVF